MPLSRPLRLADPEEVALEGWEAIGALFGKRPQNMLKRKQEMLEDGVIFYSKQGGPPPSKKVLAFPSVLKRWAIAKTTRGERVGGRQWKQC